MLLGVLAGLFCCTEAPRAAAEQVEAIYRGEAIVTGQENLAERQRGFREALQDAVVKVSGDFRLADDPRLQSALADAGHYVASFSYEDRLAKKKLMDEQGTRERSYLLRVDFSPVKIDRLLDELGSRPWPADRPRLLVLLSIQDSVGRYLLATDSQRGWGQREALTDISRRRGVPVVLPSSASASPGGQLPGIDADPARAIEQVRTQHGAGGMLLGEMILSEAGLWDTRWTLRTAGSDRTWTIEQTTFDRAIADGIQRSALRLAGLE